ncbi:MAG: orotidine-5'-phosphate decarboxylase [Candidatus Hydrogenedentota bacterium]
MNTELIVVLDVNTRDEANTIVDACAGCDWFKIGSQLFTRCGPDIVREFVDSGKKVMLDLKYHDIPNTVNHAVAAAVDLGVSLLTLHASGGSAMIEAARKPTEASNTELLAVTVLTSMNENTLRNDIGIPESPAATVPRWASMAINAGAHGIVCSAQEITLVRDAIGAGPHIVTPGIRPHWASKDDQQRIMTPSDAKSAGASHIVVGRPILNHENPAHAVQLILEELA